MTTVRPESGSGEGCGGSNGLAPLMGTHARHMMKGMVFKTITIDIDAYETLVRLKARGQSISRVIKERLGPRRGADLATALERVSLSDETLHAIGAEIDRRRETAGE